MGAGVEKEVKGSWPKLRHFERVRKAKTSPSQAFRAMNLSPPNLYFEYNALAAATPTYLSAPP